jgi:hypothetical protein
MKVGKQDHIKWESCSYNEFEPHIPNEEIKESEYISTFMFPGLKNKAKVSRESAKE